MLFDKSLKTTILSIVCATTIFTGCSTKTTSGYYIPFVNKDSSSSTNRNLDPLGKQEIRNSKAMHRATMRPYKVHGKWYYPTLAKVGDSQKGIASWYGPNFHAKKTSNGETYDMHAMTAAHKTLPMNTMVKVDNLENGKSTIVRINDRGPFISGRIIDLSNKAAHAIKMVGKGTVSVKITVLGFNAKIAKTEEEKQETASVGRYYVQVGAFSRLEGAKITKRKFELILEDRYSVIIKSTDLNRVWISGFRSEEEAQDFKEANGLSGSLIIAK